MEYYLRVIFVSVITYLSALLLCVCGVYLSIKSGFFQFRFKKIYSLTVGKLIKNRDFEGFKAMSVALGSTIGIGNIVGVSAAICIGGAGAVFWMLLTGIIGMITKFAEIRVCLEEKIKSGRQSGGPMFVFEKLSSKYGKFFGVFFGIATVLASLMAGNISQSKSIYEFADLGFSLKVLPVSLVVVPLVVLIISGKDQIFKNFSAIFVPLMSLFYVGAMVVTLVINYRNIPSAVASVLCSAFGLSQVIGGVTGKVLAVTVKTGLMKGLFTNEAGMGSSPIAHCSSNKTDSVEQGCWGIVEVFIDTVLVCMLTAFAVLTSDAYISNKSIDPFSLICNVFAESFGSFGIKALSLSAICFAFASIIGWSFYGLKALEYLSKSAVLKVIYIVLFSVLIPISSMLSGEMMWTLTDFFNSCMLIPNTLLLLYCGGEFVEVLKKGKTKNEVLFVSEKMRCRKER